MELKLNYTERTIFENEILIVPDEIETYFLFFFKPLLLKILIVPDGIETRNIYEQYSNMVEF